MNERKEAKNTNEYKNEEYKNKEGNRCCLNNSCNIAKAISRN